MRILVYTLYSYICTCKSKIRLETDILLITAKLYFCNLMVNNTWNIIGWGWGTESKLLCAFITGWYEICKIHIDAHAHPTWNLFLSDFRYSLVLGNDQHAAHQGFHTHGKLWQRKSPIWVSLSLRLQPWATTEAAFQHPPPVVLPSTGNFSET